MDSKISDLKPEEDKKEVNIYSDCRSSFLKDFPNKCDISLEVKRLPPGSHIHTYKILIKHKEAQKNEICLTVTRVLQEEA